MPDMRPNNLVWGYHGTSDRYVHEHLSHGIPRSTFPGDWLGHGCYFWEGDLERARQWSERHVIPRHGGKPAILAAVIDLTDCLDLTRTEGRELVAAIAQSVYDELPPERHAALRQNYYRREMDCKVIEFILASTRKPDGSPRFSTVRGAFQEGSPVYILPGGLISQVGDLDHIQINVTDPRAIIALDRVNL